MIRQDGVKIDPSARPDRGLAIPKRIPGKPDTWSEVGGGILIKGLSYADAVKVVRERIIQVTHPPIHLSGKSGVFKSQSQVPGEIGSPLEIILDVHARHRLPSTPLTKSTRDFARPLGGLAGEHPRHKTSKTETAIAGTIGEIIDLIAGDINPYLQVVSPPGHGQVVRVGKGIADVSPVDPQTQVGKSALQLEPSHASIRKPAETQRTAIDRGFPPGVARKAKACRVDGTGGKDVLPFDGGVLVAIRQAGGRERQCSSGPVGHSFPFPILDGVAAEDGIGTGEVMIDSECVKIFIGGIGWSLEVLLSLGKSGCIYDSPIAIRIQVDKRLGRGRIGTSHRS